MLIVCNKFCCCSELSRYKITYCPCECVTNRSLCIINNKYTECNESRKQQQQEEQREHMGRLKRLLSSLNHPLRKRRLRKQQQKQSLEMTNSSVVQTFLKQKQKDDDLLLLQPQTHFTTVEFKLLKEYFASLCADPNELFLKPQQCKQLFFGGRLKDPNFVFTEEDEFVLNAIFNAMNTDGDGLISFPEFAIALSIAVHGSFDEKVKFSFRLYDANGDGSISVQEIRNYTRILQGLGILKIDRHLHNKNISRGDEEVIELERLRIRVDNLEQVNNEVVAAAAPEDNLRGTSNENRSINVLDEVATTDIDTGSCSSDHSVPEKTTTTTFSELKTEQSSQEDEITLESNIGSSSIVPTQQEIEQLILDFFGEKELLSQNDYLIQSQTVKYFVEGLGIFDYIFYPLYRPIKEFLSIESPNERSGVLKQNNVQYYVEIRGGIMYMKDDTYHKVCKTVVNLDKVRKVVHEKQNQFALYIGRRRVKRFETITATDNVHEWIFCINMHLISRKDNRYGSFAPVRKNSLVHPLVDGKETFEAIAKAMLAAKKEIFIAGWCISPYIYLIRDYSQTNPVQYRLDQILHTMAKKGCNIYIIIWHESTLAGMNLNAIKTYNMLTSLHRNIHVVMHPKVTPFMWTHHQKIVVVDQVVAFCGGLDLTYGRFDTSSHQTTDNCALFPRWPGSDYSNLSITRNALMKSKIDAFRDVIDRDRYPREAWHDIHCVALGRIALDIASNFITRWNHHTGQQSSPMVLVEESNESNRYHTLELTAQQLISDTNKIALHYLPGILFYNTRAQIVRSMSTWSGTMRPEQSIHTAYLDLIKNAQHYIYIENQYFCSKSPQSSKIENLVAQAILERITRAILHKEVFRVYIVIPLHSSGDPLDSPVQQVLKWQRRTIHGIIDTLKDRFPDVNIDSYIVFLSLCNYGFIFDVAHYSQIYVHSKLMIVDDRYAVIGSANINDRSMVGTRDSEIAIIIEDHDTSQTLMNNKLTRVGRCVKHLRLKLWAEHLGIDLSLQQQQLQQPPPPPPPPQESKHNSTRYMNMGILYLAMKDPISEYTFNHIRNIARDNTKIYEKVFQHYPSARHTTVSEYKKDVEWYDSCVDNNVVDTSNYKLLSQIQGHLVEFPLHWLKNDKLKKDMKLQVLDDKLFF
jgi:phosphatidylserine/phosphatidylglycerophosphate/cardiolipin synthase-like enzyme/Ca2+-binding EF-hand superfamily protein